MITLSDRINELVAGMRDDALLKLYRRNCEILQQHQNNVIRMKRIVNQMSVELARRGIMESIEYNNGYTYDRT